MKKINLIFSLLILLPFLAFAQKTGNVKGTIFDASSKETLSFANISVNGTTKGVSADVEGKYILSGIPTGKQVLLFNYLGYESITKEVEIIAGKTIFISVELSSEKYMLDDVTITAQALGQQAAINQQLNSNTISSVVSKDKIQELPDQNAAESIGRLPGVSVQRDGGEGTKVVVRGLAPRFNAITINGERIPSTDASDRSVDLSMISPDMLAGIEVFKALTADKDADAIGGTVNFLVRKASEETEVDARLTTGYNNLVKSFGQTKANASVSKRFFDNKFGIIAGGNYQIADRNSENIEADYEYVGENPDGSAQLTTRSLNVNRTIEKRTRYGGNITMDYDVLNGNIMYNAMLGKSERDQVYNRRRYRVADAYQEYEARNKQKESMLFSNSLSGDHHYGNLEIDWRTSYSKTKGETPFNSRYRFRELGAFNGDLIEDQGPEYIPAGAKNNLDATFLHETYLDAEQVNDDNITGQLDFKYDFTISDKLSAYLKAGAKYRQKKRNYNYDRQLLVNYDQDFKDYISDNPDRWILDRENRILIDNFVKDYDSPNVVNGAYDSGLELDIDKLDNFGTEFKPYYYKEQTVDLKDYKAEERITAAYIMGELNYKDIVTFIPGVRVEKTENIYTGNIALGEGSGGNQPMVDSTGNKTYTELLPMMHLRIKPVEWFDVRFAATKTLARPDYYNLVPYESRSESSKTISRGNPDLKHTTVWNYDTFLSFYNKHGLFTLGLFYKDLQNIDYTRTYYSTVNGSTYRITEPTNAKGSTIIKGFEVDLQTNLSYLPAPFDGIILSANYSLIRSETFYPITISEDGPPPFFTPILTDTVRVGRMPGQAEHILNASIGYEKKGFSTRLSLTYQANSLGTLGTRVESDSYTKDFVRLDFTAQQKINKNWRVFVNVNNLLNTPEQSFVGTSNLISYERYYGLTADIGVRCKF